MDVRFLGHACFTLTDGDTTVLIDPFLTGNPSAAVSADEVQATTLLLTHGHADHVGDTVAIAKRTGAPVVAITELAGELGEEGLEVNDCNLGGTATFDWGWAKLVPAWHTSTTPKGTVNTPAGLLINFKDTIVYHLGDTALFSDLQLVGKRNPIDIALICIGGHYTMDRHDAVDAADFVGAKTIIPCHYNTFPAIETDAAAFQTDVERTLDATAVVLEPGQAHTA
ncbi:MAG TPA: metal-dependent hydrolase [Solirubrobacteraceae bacterium]|jgi:L-ascorbate metabolism protein UlaG (beta-lactamase superfamily)|nr:metal-dependent hydrolase [Solirubrobacteraceae bacterium]